MSNQPTKCIGFWGRILGHRFHDMAYYREWCTRCGMPKGGWNK